jgi:hypothetical protein
VDDELPAEPDRVADELWARVRVLAARVERLSAAADVDALTPDDELRLERARVRLARAAQRAQLADDLADQVAEVRMRRRRAGSPEEAPAEA